MAKERRLIRLEGLSDSPWTNLEAQFGFNSVEFHELTFLPKTVCSVCKSKSFPSWCDMFFDLSCHESKVLVRVIGPSIEAISIVG